MKAYALAIVALFLSGAAQGAPVTWENYTFPESNLPKDPVTGKSPYLDKQKPTTFNNDMAAAVRLGAARLLTLDEHGCNWAVTSQVFAFKDGAIYTDKGSSTYNIFPRDMVLKYGCWLPQKAGASEFIYPVQPTLVDTTLATESFPVINFADLKYPTQILDSSTASLEVAIPDRVKFVQDMAQGIQMSQKAHGCPNFAKKPYIYVFNDAVVYARLDNASYSVYSRRVVETEKKCVLPKMKVVAPLQRSAPVNFAAAGLTQNPEIKLTNASTAPGPKSYLDQGFADRKCEGSWSWQTSHPNVTLAMNRVVTYPKDPTLREWNGNTRLSFPGQSPVQKVKIVTPTSSFVHIKDNDGNHRIRTAMYKEAQTKCNEQIASLPKIYAFNPGHEVSALGAKKPFFQHLLDAGARKGSNSSATDYIQEMYAKIEGKNYSYIGAASPSFQSIGLVKESGGSVSTGSGSAGSDASTKNTIIEPIAASYDHTKPESVLFVTPNDTLQSNRYTGELISMKPVITHIPEPINLITLLMYSGVQFECEAIIQPRVLVPQAEVYIPDANVPDTFTYEFKLNRYPTQDLLVDAKGNPILGVKLDDVAKLAPLKDYDGPCKIDRTGSGAPRVKCTRYTPGVDSSGKDLTAEVAKAGELFEATVMSSELMQQRTPEKMECSSGDHLPSLVVDTNGGVNKSQTQEKVIAKYNFLFNSIRRYMKTVSLVDYVKRGYCQKLDSSCTFEKSPELSAMFKNFQALRVEKAEYLFGYNGGLPIVTIEDFYFLSENSVYPEHKL